MAGGDGAMVFVDHEHLSKPPVQGPGYLADYEAGVGAAIAVLGAYFHRYVSGNGQFIDFSIQEWCLMLNGLFLAKYPNENILMDRRKMGYSLGGLMACKDGHLIIMLITDHHWWRLVKLMGNPPWAFEERFDTQFKRTSHGEELNVHIREWFRKHPKEELYHMIQKAGIPAAPVYSPDEVLASDQMEERSFFSSPKHPQAGKITMPAVPYRFSRSEYGAPGSAPGLGEHNRQVYGELGITDEEIEKLHDKGII
jgi:crotonobetainyl-CoA:carnitine CoA-transferase CaiB-like acyl-CoA transferase